MIAAYVALYSDVTFAIRIDSFLVRLPKTLESICFENRKFDSLYSKFPVYIHACFFSKTHDEDVQQFREIVAVKAKFHYANWFGPASN